MIVTFSNVEELPHRVSENFEVYLGREAEWHNLCLLYSEYLANDGLWLVLPRAAILLLYSRTHDIANVLVLQCW